MESTERSQKEPTHTSKAATLPPPRDTLCGLGCHPESLQKCAVLPGFIVFYSIAGLMTQTLITYISSQITSIEKQFGLSSKQSGFLLICNDIGFVVAVLFVSHFLAKKSIPLYLGMLSFLFGVSGIICALPHFMLGVDGRNFGNSGYGGSTASNTLCRLDWNVSRHDISDCADNEVTRYHSAAFITIAVGMIIQGIAKSPRTSLTTTYVDNNITDRTRTAFFLGIITAIGVLGPALAMGLGSVFSSIYVTLEDVEITPRNPLWIGAWWLGFVIFGVGAMVISVPVMCFPKQMPEAARRKYLAENSDKMCTESFPMDSVAQMNNEQHEAKKIQNIVFTVDQNGNAANGINVSTNSKSPPREEDEISGPEIQNKICTTRGMKEFLRLLRELCMNSVFVLIVLSGAIKMMAISGAMSYGPKFVEVQFMKTAWEANLIFGGSRLIDAFCGTLLGGYLSSRLRLTRTGNMKLVTIASTVGCIASGIIIAIGCNQPVIRDFDRIRNPSASQIQKLSADIMCGDACDCHHSQFFPICGDDGNNFYSPCYAGCKNNSGQNYAECSCISHNGTATAGFCEDGCSQIIAFVTVGFIMAISFTITLVPTYMAVIRSVSEEAKPVALGIGILLNTLLGLLPGPVIFGMIYDKFCLLWRESCGERGSCALYDMYGLRIAYQSLSFCLNMVALLVIVTGLIVALKKERKSFKLPEPTTVSVKIDGKY